MIRINILPHREIKRKENVRRQVSVFVLSVFLAMCFMWYLASNLSRQISDLETNIETAQKELKDLEAVVQEVNSLKQELEKIEAKVAVIKKLEANRGDAVRVMDAFTGLVLKGKMWLTHLTEQGKALSLEGVAMDNKVVADFLTRLQESAHFEAVELLFSTQVTISGRKFQKFKITCRLSSEEAEAEPQTS